MAKAKSAHRPSRRAFVKKAAYIAPVILTLSAAPSFAKPGSDKKSTQPWQPPGQ